MFNYRNASIIAYIILALLIVLNLFIDIGYIPYLVLLLVCGGIIFCGSAFVNSGFYFKMICSAKTDKKIFAITFDDGPTSVTPEILDILISYKVTAAFFVIGSRATMNEQIIKRIDEEGHLLGNHSFSHHNLFPLYSGKRIRDELKKTEDIIERIIGKRVNIFRPPFGVTNPSIGRTVKSLDYISVGWSVKSKDTVIDDAGRIARRIKRKLKPGGIILLHDTKEKTAVALKEVLEFAKQHKYEVVRLDDLLCIKPYKS